MIILKKLNWALWWRGILASFIGGGATSATAWLGMAAAKSVGVDVPFLNFKALGIIFLSGAITNMLSYLKQSPLPIEEDIPMDSVEVKTITKTPSKLD